jgi:hypothetical protein
MKTTIWTKKRKISFWVHVGFVSIPFVASTAASFTFWSELFNSVYVAIPMVLSVEILALTGLLLFIMKIESPFVWLRHLLPFISVGPLVYELYKLLSHNGPIAASVFTAIIAGLSIFIARECFNTIENQFIDPIEQAKEKVREDLAPLVLQMEQYRERDSIFAGFLADTLEERGISLLPNQQRRIAGETTTNTQDDKPCPKCGSPLTHMKYMHAHRKNADGSLRGCEQCSNVLVIK